MSIFVMIVLFFGGMILGELIALFVVACNVVSKETHPDFTCLLSEENCPYLDKEVNKTVKEND